MPYAICYNYTILLAYLTLHEYANPYRYIGVLLSGLIYEVFSIEITGAYD